jgi:hypothetical protein
MLGMLAHGRGEGVTLSNASFQQFSSSAIQQFSSSHFGLNG